jgi:hypothetical protein
VLLRLLGSCAAVTTSDPERFTAIDDQARIILADAEREVAQPRDLALVYAEADSVSQLLTARGPARSTPPDPSRTEAPPN